MRTIQIIADENTINYIFKQTFGEHSHFDLRKDYKKCFGRDFDSKKRQLLGLLALELEKPIQSLCKISRIRGSTPQVFLTKLRLKEPETNKGKRSGLRCIMLIDGKQNWAFLLHLYRKNKDKNDISPNDTRSLSQVLGHYIESEN